MTLMTRLIAPSALTLALATAASAAEVYRLDPTHTAVTFKIDHFGFSAPSGKFMDIDGTVMLDEANPAASKVRVVLPIAKLNTGLADLDTHLKAKDFFDTAAHPTATFVSDKVELTGKDTAVVHGLLTLRGVTKPVDLNVKLNKIGTNMKEVKTAGFSASAVLKRSDFGMDAYLPGLGDTVTLDIESEANLVGK